MNVIKIIREQLEMIGGAEKLLETEVSIPEIMTGNADDAPGLSKMYGQELEEQIRRITPREADAYMIGKIIMGELRHLGSIFQTDVTYPIIFFNLPSYL